MGEVDVAAEDLEADVAEEDLGAVEVDEVEEASEEEEEAAVDVGSEVGPFFNVLHICTQVVFPGMKEPISPICCLLTGGN